MVFQGETPEVLGIYKIVTLKMKHITISMYAIRGSLHIITSKLHLWRWIGGGGESVVDFPTGEGFLIPSRIPNPLPNLKDPCMFDAEM